MSNTCCSIDWGVVGEKSFIIITLGRGNNQTGARSQFYKTFFFVNGAAIKLVFVLDKPFQLSLIVVTAGAYLRMEQ